MARSTRLTLDARTARLRLDSPELDSLWACVSLRYPDYEWATFAKFGWRATSRGLVLTLASIDLPQAGDLDASVGHVSVQEAYTLRTALQAESHPLAIGIVHSHPRQCPPIASPLDDDMDSYYAEYFAAFATGRPFVSLIMSEIDDVRVVAGRVAWNGQWLGINATSAPGAAVRVWDTQRGPAIGGEGRRKRFADAFGVEAARLLRQSTVAVIGAGGTGSAAVEVFARAGVGRLIIVDPDHVEDSNLERVHGSLPDDAALALPKVEVAKRHVASIDPTIRVEALVGSLPHSEVVDAVVTADVMIGCTDQQHSRLAMADIARRYLVPSLDCGVALEGADGNVSAQVIQLTRFLPADACPLCRRMILSGRVAQELMSPAEQSQRMAAAAAAEGRGQNGRGYWQVQPQLNTVGYLTTAAAAMAAGYVIGWLTDRFNPPFTRLQMNLVAPFLDVTDVDDEPRVDCTCRSARGWADQGLADALVTAPSHWPPVRAL